jgi:hypothetical protein
MVSSAPVGLRGGQFYQPAALSTVREPAATTSISLSIPLESMHINRADKNDTPAPMPISTKPMRTPSNQEAFIVS